MSAIDIPDDDDNVIPLFNRDVFLDPIKAHKVVDRFPLEVRGAESERPFIGVLDADGVFCSPQGIRSPKATRALSMKDRLVVWDYDDDTAEVVRLGAMTYMDLHQVSVHYGRHHYGKKPGLLAQALGLLWNQVLGDGFEPMDPTVTLESLDDPHGRSVLDCQWTRPGC